MFSKKLFLEIIVIILMVSILQYHGPSMSIKGSEIINQTVTYDIYHVGEHWNFSSIQSAIDNSTNGDTIIIHPGEYNESVIINKTLTIIGSGVQDTIILGYWLDVVVELCSNYTNISELSIVGYGSYSGLLISGNYNTVSNCYFMWNVIGITFKESGYNSIINCTCFQNTGAGVYLGGGYQNLFKKTNCSNTIYGSGFNLWGATKNRFTDCLCCNNKGDGFYAYWLSSDNVIDNSIFCKNQGNGLYILDSDRFTINNCKSIENKVNGFSISSIKNNIINCQSSNNNYSGFSFYHLEDSRVNNCLSCFNRRQGLYFKYSIRNDIANNTMVSNFNHSLYFGIGSDENKIYGNLFVNNKAGTDQTWDKGKNNVWYHEKLGNYWWDYKYHYPESKLIDNLWNVSFEIAPNYKTVDKYPLSEHFINKSYIEDLQRGIWNDTDYDGIYDLIDEFPENPEEYKDSDEDGIGDNYDAFPYDPAASIDSDTDHFPDEWNTGYDDKDSITNLKLDEYPNDPSRWKKEDQNVFSLILLSVIISLIFLISITIFVYWYNFKKHKTK
jgi:parallel beta-helix repeat protein